jgi:hypothetical protein
MESAETVPACGALGAGRPTCETGHCLDTDAARVKAGCSGDNLSKTETMIENMADGEGKIAAQKEIAAAQDAMLSGKMGACAAHLSKAMHVGTAK